MSNTATKIPVKYIDTTEYVATIENDSYCYDSVADFTDAFEIIEFTSQEQYDEYATDKSIAKQMKKGEMFYYDKYEHGGCSFTLENEGMNCRWDTTRRAGVIKLNHVNDDATYEQRKEMARADLNDYTSIYNGDVYSIRITDNQGKEVDYVCGYVGYDNAVECVYDLLPNSPRENITIKDGEQ